MGKVRPITPLFCVCGRRFYFFKLGAFGQYAYNPRSSKVAPSLIFELGILDIGAGIGRLVTISQVDEKDPAWSEVPALQWLATEPSIAIIVACLMVCRPLMEKLGPASWRQSSRKSHVNKDHIKLVSRKLDHLSRKVAVMVAQPAASSLLG